MARDKVFQIRLTEEERRAFAAAAQSAGMSRAVWLRHAAYRLLGDQAPLRPPYPATPQSIKLRATAEPS